jgi:hypothetical protein
MRLKRPIACARVCVFASFVVLSATALTVAPALALPEGRVYEMVSPPYKAGYGVGNLTEPIRAVALNGEGIVFTSQGSFGGGLSTTLYYSYLARRGPSGWSTVPLSVPASLAPSASAEKDFSPELDYTFSQAGLGPNYPTAQTSNEIEYLLHRTDTPDTPANWEVAGGMVLRSVNGKPIEQHESTSGEECHVVLDVEGAGALLHVSANVHESLYDFSRGCTGEPYLRFLGLNNKGTVIDQQCGARLGAQPGGSVFNAISADGREIFFQANANPERTQCRGFESSSKQVFVRLDGTSTLEVSRPLGECKEVPCTGAVTRAFAQFQGASEDGSRALFTTTAQLTGEDKDEGNDLYMATIGCPAGERECEVASKRVTSLVQVSHDPTAGEAAEVQGLVVRVAPDGARVYFIARGVLSQAPNSQGQTPLKGADNLYEYDAVSGAPPMFVADLCSGPGRSGTAEDARCPLELNEDPFGGRNDLDLWGGFQVEAQSTGDGRYLVFSSYGRLLKGDADNAKDIYRYDAVTGQLDRVSIGEAGYDANGNRNNIPSGPSSANATIQPAFQTSNFDLAHLQHETAQRAVSEDGSRIVFTTTEPLSPDARNQPAAVYEWHKEPGWSEGAVSMISSGTSLTNDSSVVISPSGLDIFFLTSQGLVPQDTDGQVDVYDARLGGGFPQVPPPAAECSGDACQGPLTNPFPLLVPGSVSQVPGGNFAAPAPAPVITPKRATPKCSKGKTLSHGKCVKSKTKRKKTKAKKASNNRRARR